MNDQAPEDREDTRSAIVTNPATAPPSVLRRSYTDRRRRPRRAS
jgi:hypothetical protein